MLGLLTALSLAATSLPYSASDEAAASEWIIQAGHRFDPSTLSDADLSPLVDRLAGAQVIGIGEATHGTRQDAAFKVQLIKDLIRFGKIDVLAVECNRAAAAALSRYVTTGEGDPVLAMRSRSFFSIWRNDEFADLIVWLRAWTTAGNKSIRIVGIDNQDTSTDAAYAITFLARQDFRAAEKLRASLSSLLSPTGDGSPAIWVMNNDKSVVDQALTAVSEVEHRLDNAPPLWRSRPGYDEARYAAKIAHQGLVEFSGESRGADVSKLEPEYFSRRDTFMAGNLLDRIGAGHAALWAHDEHVASAFGERDEKQGSRSLGSVLHTILGVRYRTVGFTWSRAVVHAVALAKGTPPPPREQRRFSTIALDNKRPGDLGHVFDQFPGDALWIDMAARPHSAALDRWGSTPTYRGWAGWRIDPETWQIDPNDEATNPPDIGFDVLVWFRLMSPARSWPETTIKPQSAGS